VQYVASGCHVTGGGTSGGKHVGYCDCAAAWPPSQDLVHTANLIWQTPDDSAPTLTKSIYCRRATSGCAASTVSPLKSPPDLFIDTKAEVPTTSSSNTIGRVKASAAHLYESPVFSHFDRLLH